MTLPNFLYIGTSRAGSTWLYQALDEHPQVFVPPAKDIFFFDRLYARGIEWYESNFPSDPVQYTAVGEVSHDYFQSKIYLRRIADHLPGVKLIVCLREPGSQSRSAYHWWTTHGKFSGTVEEFTRSELCISAIDYYKNLKAVYDLFPREQILVVFYEDLQRDAEAYIRRIYQFVGVDTAFFPSIIDQRVNAEAGSRSHLLTSLAYSVGQVLRRLGLGSWVGRVKFNPTVQRILYKKGAAMAGSTDSDQAVQALRSRCREWYPALEALLQKPLPSEWK